MALPSTIVIHSAEGRYVMLNIIHRMNKESMPYIMFKVIDNPKNLIENSYWRNNQPTQDVVSYTCVRESSVSGPTIYTAHLTRTHRILVTEGGDIPEYKLESRNTILESKFYHVTKDDDPGERWHFKDCMVRPEPLAAAASAAIPSTAAASASHAKIPKHILKVFIEDAISKNSLCPITMESLTVENASITSCGHLFDKEALRISLKRCKKCPMCRTDANPDEIQTL